jgi:ABC-type transporter Mla subunit MlaD
MRRLLSERFGRPVGEPRARFWMILLGLAGIGITLIMVYVGFKAPDAIPGRAYFTVRAQFKDADNVSKHSQVRIGGRIVGQVLDPHVEHGLAVVKLQMDPTVKPLLSDTRVVVRPRSAVGVRFLDVVPGTRGRPLRDGDLITDTQTAATRQLDEVLSTFDPATRTNTQRFLRELGRGVLGRGQGLSEALDSAPDFLAGTQQVAGAIVDRPGAMSNLIRGSESTAAAADPVREPLADGFAPEARALRPFADRAVSLQRTLDVAPGALSAVRTGLAQTDPLVSELSGLGRTVRPALAAAPRAFTQTSMLLREARPGLRSADRTLRLTGRAVSPTLGLLGAIRPVLPNLDTVLSDSVPIVSKLGAHSCDIKLFGKTWGSMMTYGNAGGGWLRLNLVGGSQQSVYGLGDGAGPAADTGNFQNAYPQPCQAGTERPGG